MDLSNHSRSRSRSLDSNSSTASFSSADSSRYRFVASLGKQGTHILPLIHSYERIERLEALPVPLPFSPNEEPPKALIVEGQRIFSAHRDGKIRVWKKTPSRGHKLLATLPTFRDCVATFLTPKSSIPHRRHNKHLWIKHFDLISTLALGPLVLYSGSWDKTIKVWRLSDFKCLESIPAHDDAVNALTLDHKGLLYSASADSRVKIWEKGPLKHTLVDTLDGHVASVNALALGLNGQVLYSGSSDKTIGVWQRGDSGHGWGGVKGPRFILRGHHHAILCLAATMEVLCSGSCDKSIRVWRHGSANSTPWCFAVIKGHSNPVKSITMSMESKSGCHICTCGLDGHVKVWWISFEEDNMDIQE